MKFLKHRYIPKEKYLNAFLGYGPEDSHFVLELTYNYGIKSFNISARFGYFEIAIEDIYKRVEDGSQPLGSNVEVILVAGKYRQKSHNFLLSSSKIIKTFSS